MAKRTIHLDKVMRVETELLEEAAETILRELGRRHDQLAEEAQETGNTAREAYGRIRADRFHDVKDLYLDRPRYQKHFH